MGNVVVNQSPMEQKEEKVKRSSFFGILFDFMMVVVLVVNLSGYYYIAKGHHPVVFGWSTACVVSGSMEPTIPVGAFVIIQEADEYKAGDIVVYHHAGINHAVIHRIVSIDGAQVTTKGDANHVADPVFNKNQIYGKMVFMIPGLGNIIQTMQKSAYLRIVIIALVIGLITSYIAPLCMDDKRRKRTSANSRYDMVIDEKYLCDKGVLDR